MRRYLLLVILLMANVTLLQAEPMRDFVPGSYSNILAARQGKPFVLVIWSLDCLPCHKELAMLGLFKQQHPLFDVVLISTDESARHKELQAVLNKYQLQTSNSWIFASASAEQLRYEIDPTWYGELPRSYLFNHRHLRQTISGLLSTEVLTIWWQRD